MFGNISDIVSDSLGALSDAIVSLGTFFQQGLTNVAQSFTNGLNSIGDFVSDGFNIIGLKMSNLWYKIDYVQQNIIDGFNDIGDDFNVVSNNLVLVLDYLNPSSENFFLKIAFVPDENFFDTEITALHSDLMLKFTIFDQIKDTFLSISNSSYLTASWEGIHMDMTKYGIGMVTIVNPVAINYVAPKVRFWISGAIYLLMIFFTINKFSDIINS